MEHAPSLFTTLELFGLLVLLALIFQGLIVSFVQECQLFTEREAPRFAGGKRSLQHQHVGLRSFLS